MFEGILVIETYASFVGLLVAYPSGVLVFICIGWIIYIPLAACEVEWERFLVEEFWICIFISGPMLWSAIFSLISIPLGLRPDVAAWQWYDSLSDILLVY